MNKDTIAGAISNYLLHAPWYRRIIDVALICLIIILYGVVTNNITFNVHPQHSTLERAHIQSEEVRNVLQEVQYKYNPSITANFVYHNGIKSLDGTFSFIKFSLAESVSKHYITVNPIAFRDVPYSIHLNMISSFMNGECYSTRIGQSHPFYYEYARVNTNYITTCPIYSKHGNLNSFILVGTDTDIDIPHNDLKEFAKRLEKLQ